MTNQENKRSPEKVHHARGNDTKPCTSVKRLVSLGKRTAGRRTVTEEIRDDYRLCAASIGNILSCLVEDCAVDSKSFILAINGGFQIINSVASITRMAIGIESDKLKYNLSMIHVKAQFQTNLDLHNALFMYNKAKQCTTTDPFTHVLLFDMQFTDARLREVAVQFNTSHHAKYLMSYHPPHRLINACTFDVTFLTSTPVWIEETGEAHTCYFYARLDLPPSLLHHPVDGVLKQLVVQPLFSVDEQEDGEDDEEEYNYKVTEPAQGEEAIVELHCDPIFFPVCQVLLAPDKTSLRRRVSEAVTAYLDGERPQRVRRPIWND